MDTVQGLIQNFDLTKIIAFVLLIFAGLFVLNTVGAFFKYALLLLLLAVGWTLYENGQLPF